MLYTLRGIRNACLKKKFYIPTGIRKARFFMLYILTGIRNARFLCFIIMLTGIKNARFLCFICWQALETHVFLMFYVLAGTFFLCFIHWQAFGTHILLVYHKQHTGTCSFPVPIWFWLITRTMALARGENTETKIGRRERKTKPHERRKKAKEMENRKRIFGAEPFVSKKKREKEEGAKCQGETVSETHLHFLSSFFFLLFLLGFQFPLPSQYFFVLEPWCKTGCSPLCYHGVRLQSSLRPWCQTPLDSFGA